MAKVSLRAYHREIETMIDRNQLEEAIAHCHHILKTYPKYLETYRLLGKAYLEAKRYADAVDIFSRVLAADPNDFVSHVGMSIIRDEENKLDDAIWHMERAFEVQPSNAAVQAELQRLYGRRDGVTPPRIRLTRGALAHMYLHGELYPQAISEIKSVLQEDAGRTDLQVLLARAYFRNGQKNDAAEVASSLLKRYPYCLDANRVLVEIFGVEKPESAQIYRKRVIELDPYAAHVTGTVFQSSEVPDAAVTIEHFDWSGRPSTLPPEWASTQAIKLDAGLESEQPDWLKSAAEPYSAPASEPFVFDQSQSQPASAFEEPRSSSMPSAAQAEDDIPDFLRAAGWGKATGAFDESKSAFTFEEEAGAPSEAEPIEKGELPDWLKSMAPPEVLQPPAEEKEEPLPDWIANLGKGAVESVTASPTDITADGVSDSKTTEEQPDWLKALASETEAPPSPSAKPFEETKTLGKSEKEQEDAFAWLESLAAKQGATEGLLTKPEERLEEEPEWIKQAKALAEEQPASEQPQVSTSKPEIDQEDAFAWLESLAAKQGATEGLLTKPEERREEPPAWVKQSEEVSEQLPTSQEPASALDIDAWLKSLEEEEAKPEPVSPLDETAVWLKSLDEQETPKAEEMPSEELPEWLRGLEEEKAAAAETAIPAREAEKPTQVSSIGEVSASVESRSEVEEIPSWLKGIEEERPVAPSLSEELPAWLLDETGEVVAEPPKIEPTRPADWHPVEEMKEMAQTETLQPKPEPEPEPEPPPAPKPKKPAKREQAAEPYKEPVTRKATGMLDMPLDPILAQARSELSRSNIPGALEAYAKLIKKGRYLDEVVYDLREALYRYPVEVSIWQALGDAYMRANRLQDALDAYTKAEELLR